MRSNRKRISQKADKLIKEAIKLNSSKTKRQKPPIPEKISDLLYNGGFSIIGISMGAWMLSIGLSNYQSAANFKNKAVATTGIITKTSYQSRTISSGGFPSSYTVEVPTIQFKTRQGETIQFEGDDDLCRRSCSGKEVPIFYDSDNPHQTMVKGGSSPLDKARSNIGWGTFIIISSIAIFISSFYKLLKEYGRRINLTRRN